MLEEAIIVADQKTEEIISDIQDAIIGGISSALKELNSQVDKLNELSALKSAIFEVKNNTLGIAELTKTINLIQTEVDKYGTIVETIEEKLPNDLKAVQGDLLSLDNSIKNKTSEIVKEVNNFQEESQKGDRVLNNLLHNVLEKLSSLDNLISEKINQIGIRIEEIKKENETTNNNVIKLNALFEKEFATINDSTAVITEQLKKNDNSIIELYKGCEDNTVSIKKIFEEINNNSKTSDNINLQIEEIKKLQISLYAKYSEKWYKKIFNIFTNK